MKTRHNEILIYYNPENSAHRKVVAYAQSLVPQVKAYAFDKAFATGRIWQEILKALQLRPKDLLNKAHPYYQEHIRGCDFDEECWLKVLRKNPDLMKAPIALRGGQAVLCNNATDIYKLTSAGLVAT